MLSVFIILVQVPNQANILSRKLASIWVFAQIILFPLVGAEVNIELAIEAGLIGLMSIAIGLLARSAGGWRAPAGSNLCSEERLLWMIAYVPTATGPAGIG